MRLFRPRVLATFFSVGLGAVMALASPGPQQDATTQPAETLPAPGEEGPLVADGPAPDLALIYTGGVVGYVEPCG